MANAKIKYRYFILEKSEKVSVIDEISFEYFQIKIGLCKFFFFFMILFENIMVKLFMGLQPF